MPLFGAKVGLDGASPATFNPLTGHVLPESGNNPAPFSIKSSTARREAAVTSQTLRICTGVRLNYVTELSNILRDLAYNFTKIHRTLRLSPGMAEVTDRLWDVLDLVALWESYDRKAESAALRSGPGTTKAAPQLRSGQSSLHEASAPAPQPSLPPHRRINHSWSGDRHSYGASAKLANKITLSWWLTNVRTRGPLALVPRTR
jgi:hypothetical protein